MLARRVHGRAVAVAALCLLTVNSAPAQQPADQDVINQSIERGKKFLQKEQKPTGYWGDSHPGYTALAGLTLVECGVPTTDPGLKRAANIIRSKVPELDGTYEMALAILFLDRMKDKSDKRHIQLLAGRLIAAQSRSGGWGYKAMKHPESDVTQLLAALRKMGGPITEPAKAAEVVKIQASLPPDIRRVAVLFTELGRLPADAKDKSSDLYDPTTDNSNTHFAMLGLWAARKHDVPVDRTFALVNRRFRTSQGPGGTWAYNFIRTGADGGGPHTCIALLGVAIGHVVAPEPDVKPETDPVIVSAFVALSKTIGAPVGDTKNRPTVKDAGGLYFLWAMERIAVLYDLQKLGKKDWYQWGAEILVCHQLGDGSWGDDGGFPGQAPVVNTCLALLFLRRANLTPDLSKRLVVNTAALTAKVDDKIAPKPEPPAPTQVVVAPTIEIAPPPHTVELKPQPPAPTPTVTPPAPAPEAPAPAKKGPWLWIVLGTLLAGAIGGGLAFLFLAKRRKDDDEDDDDDDDDDEKKKKKGKKKAKAAGPKKKAKAKVELDEDE
jgi:hypothetical protein